MIRPIESQLKLAEKIDSLYKKGIKNIVLEAPTGNGKSGIAWFTHKITKMKACVLSHQKILQDQYHDLLRNEVDFCTLKGKNNYTCDLYPKYLADTAPCSYSMGFFCPKRRTGECEYYRTKSLAEGADFLNTNYQLVMSFYDADPALFPFKKSLYIYDECHNLHDMYTDYRTIRIGKTDLKAYDRLKELGDDYEIDELVQTCTNAKKFYEKIFNNISKINEENGLDYIKQAFEYKEMTKTILSDYINENYKELIETMQLKKFGGYCNYERKCLCKFSNLMDNWEYVVNDDNFVIEKDEGENFEIKLIPLKIGHMFKKDSSEWSKNKLFMSSTIFGARRFINELGLGNEPFEFISLDSKFPLENRPVYSIPLVNLNNKILYDENNNKILDNYYKTIYDIVEQHTQKNESGLIFVPSYKLMNLLIKNIGNDVKKLNVELLYNEDSGNRELIINKFIVILILRKINLSKKIINRNY